MLISTKLQKNRKEREKKALSKLDQRLAEVAYLRGVVFRPIGQLDVVKGIEQQLTDAVLALQLFGPALQKKEEKSD